MSKILMPSMAASLAISCATALADIPIRATRIVSGLSSPVFVTSAPGDTNRLFIVEQGSGTIGTVKIFKYSTGTLNANPFITVPDLAVGGEQGLLGLAFHPDYASNGYFYLNSTIPGGAYGNGITQITRYTRSDADTSTFTSAQTVLTFDQPQTNHNGGWMGFSPRDGYLYIASGDGGGGGDGNDGAAGHTPGIGNALDTSKLLGKILRLDVNSDDFPADSNRNYHIPSNNPFVGIAGAAPENWAYGLRNPWRNSFDRQTHDLYIGDVGQGAQEEVDFQAANFPGGANYGWRAMEGTATTSYGTAVPPQPPRVDPIYSYTHSDPINGGIAIVGGYVYRGNVNDALEGTYFFGDYGNGRMWSFKFDGTNITHFKKLTGGDLIMAGGQTINNISSFGEDEQGRLYVVDLDGEIYRLDPYISGDANKDGVVDRVDLGIMARHWLQSSGAKWADADFTDDGMVDIRDLRSLAQHWAQNEATLFAAMAAAELPAAVPEPQIVAVVSFVGCALRRRRR